MSTEQKIEFLKGKIEDLRDELRECENFSKHSFEILDELAQIYIQVKYKKFPLQEAWEEIEKLGKKVLDEF